MATASADVSFPTTTSIATAATSGPYADPSSKLGWSCQLRHHNFTVYITPGTTQRGSSISSCAGARAKFFHRQYSFLGGSASRLVIEPRSHKPKLTDAQKASRAIARQQKQASTKKLDDAIKTHVEEQVVKITELAAAHNTSVERVKAMVGINTHYKKSRKPALHNAILHAQAERVNRGEV